jgi:hypothetical protein
LYFFSHCSYYCYYLYYFSSFFLEASKRNTHGINLPHGGSGIVVDAVQLNAAVKPVSNGGNYEGVVANK